MKKHLFFYTIFFILILLFSAFRILLLEEAMYKVSITLEDGEKITSDSLFVNFIRHDLEEVLPEINSQNAILRSFDTDRNDINDFQLYLNYLIKSEIVDYWKVVPINVLPAEYTFYLPNGEGSNESEKISGVQNYYRSLFKSKAVRDILFKSALDYIVILCKKNPIDFKERILIELDKQLKFSNSLKFLNYDEDASYDNYWEGFIYRRHFMDNVPIFEIQTKIMEAKNKISQTVVSHKKDVLYEIKINNQLALYYSGKSSFIKSLSSLKKIYFYESDDIHSIKYLKDITGDYYQIVFLVNGFEKRVLYNKNLEKIN